MRVLRSALLGLALLSAAAAHAGPTGEPEPELRAAMRKAIAAADSFEHRYDAEVWLVDMSGRLQKIVPDEQQRLELLRLIHREARRAKLAPELVLAVIEVESRFDTFAVSSAGAQGLMQIMPFWLKEIGRPNDNLFHPQTNLRMGCTILQFYLEKSRGNLIEALARYNGSYGRPEYPSLVVNALNRRWYRS